MAGTSKKTISDKDYYNKRKAEVKIKKKLAKLKQNIGSTEDVDTFSQEKASSLLDNLNETYKEIKTTAAAKIDSDVFNNLSARVMKITSEQAKLGAKVDLTTFLDKIKTNHRVQGSEDVYDEIDWHDLGDKVSCFFNGISGGNFLLGSLKIAPKEKKARQVAVRKEKHQEIAPDVVKNAGGPRKRTHHEMMQAQIHKLLPEPPAKDQDMKKYKKKCMFNFLTNPDSFTQTVENIFEFSFLVKDSAKIKLDEDQQPYVFKHEKDSTNQQWQSILSFDMNDWEQIKKLYQVEESYIPNRTDKVYDGTN